MPARARRVVHALSFATVAVLLGVLLWHIVRGRDAGASGALDAGKVVAAPRLDLPRLDAPGRRTLASLHGKVVVVNFWASWCLPCRQEASLLERTWTQDRSRGLVVLGVDANDFAADGRRFARKHGLTYPLLHDAHGSTLGHWGVFGLPFTFVVDRRGRVVDKVAGGLAVGDNYEHLRHAISRVLPA